MTTRGQKPQIPLGQKPQVLLNARWYQLKVIPFDRKKHFETLFDDDRQVFRTCAMEMLQGVTRPWEWKSIET